MTKKLSGKKVAQFVYSDLEKRISSLAQNGVIPTLAAVIVGSDPASQVYVRSKMRKFRKLGLNSKTFFLSGKSTSEEIVSEIKGLNNDDRFHGILVQLPLPDGIDSNAVLRSVSVKKDVDGFHPENVGLLSYGNPRFIPCTPKGIFRILQYYGIETMGKHAVVVGRSNIVGRPISAILSAKSRDANATVTICHSKTDDLSSYTQQADILIASAGIPGLINGEMISNGAVVIDVGITRVDDRSDKGYSLVGDVDAHSVDGIAGALTPVPGGVGPMTIAMLVENTVEAAERSILT
ncbi:MAG: bifunctional 5,10-methylene-tetrahydrofolate dehydrogenase/5,10-methylene-tetrahydrofolate cyclohydrolase [Candidatus Marinimicrobia bacterium]|nr:bifunctional 5,10-methylene-tetrahydrofolate dehydrogenase/5,10-methylene-tetrahydrofolate cyclohydrolase [Candidatus Neomarinimicrobiota bacterium]